MDNTKNKNFMYTVHGDFFISQKITDGWAGH